MKEIELFHLTRCPYCINARKAIGELLEENPAYAALSIRWIEESEEKELADHSFDVIKKNIRTAFDEVLAAE